MRYFIVDSWYVFILSEQVSESTTAWALWLCDFVGERRLSSFQNQFLKIEPGGVIAVLSWLRLELATLSRSGVACRQASEKAEEITPKGWL